MPTTDFACSAGAACRQKRTGARDILRSAAAALFLAMPVTGWAQGIGVGVLPVARGSGDEVERILYEIVFHFPGIDQIWAPTPNFEAMLSQIGKLKEQGRSIGYMILASHGAAKTPHIEFANGDLGPETVDLPAMRAELGKYREYLGKLPDGENRQKACTAWKSLRDRINRLESVSAAFSPGTKVLLINCSAAATSEGQQFVRNLGEVLLGRNGGSIIASRVDVELNANTWRNRAHDNLCNNNIWNTGPSRCVVGDYFYAGDFVSFPIAAHPEWSKRDTFATDKMGTLRVELGALTDAAKPAKSKITVTENGKVVATATLPEGADHVDFSLPAVHAGTKADGSMAGETDPAALVRYTVRVQDDRFEDESKDALLTPNDELGSNCHSLGATNVLLYLRPKEKKPGPANPCRTSPPDANSRIRPELSGCGSEPAGSDDQAQFVWNRTPDAYTVIGSKGMLTGSVESWHFSGPATINGNKINASVTCSGQRTEVKKDAPPAGKMTCDIAWEKNKWHCSGPGGLKVSWSLGDYWFGMWPQSCEGTVTENGKSQPNKFGLVGLKSKLGSK